MSFKDNQDLRIRTLDWFWGEQELFTVFAPIIGPHAVAVYAAMARMIPLAGVRPEVKIDVRLVSEWSCVGRSKCAEEMALLQRLGMVQKQTYLDGRPDTWKLASLRELAKKSERELLRLAGVRDTDTAPFDQKKKHDRERELRAKKREQISAQEAKSRPVPLFDQSNAADGQRVRAADTASDDPNPEPGVRNAATGVRNAETVSAIRTPFKYLKSEKSDELKTSLRRGAASEVGEIDPAQGRPDLPKCTAADTTFAAALPVAAAWVMGELGITDRNLARVIAAQLQGYCVRNAGAILADVAAMMSQQGRLLWEHADQLLHRPWNWHNFFAHGHWARPLPYDSFKQRAAEDGVRREMGIEDEIERSRQERVAAYVRDNAARIEAAGHADIALKLWVLAAEDLPLDDLDKKLQDVEDELFEEMHAQLTADELVECRKQVDEELAGNPAVLRMNPKQRDDVKGQKLRQLIHKQSGMPRLSLFYMPPS